MYSKYSRDLEVGIHLELVAGELVELGLELLLAGARKFRNHLAVDVELEGGHGTDLLLFGGLAVLVNINLHKGDTLVSVLLRELLEDGANAFARTAPGGGEVNGDLRFFRVAHQLLEVSKVLNHLRHGECALRTIDLSRCSL